MTRKDYELIAKVVEGLTNDNEITLRAEESLSEWARRKAAVAFAKVLHETNPRFDAVKFFNACGL